MKARKIVVAMSMIFLLCSTNAWSDSNDMLLAKIYSDMAHIYDSNMNDPDRCVKEITAYLNENGSDFLHAQQKHKEKLEEKYKNTSVDLNDDSAEDIRNKLDSMFPVVMPALRRYLTSKIAFGVEHRGTDYTDKIDAVMKKFGLEE